MSVAVFVTNEVDAASLIPWGVQFACADHTELLIVCPKKSKGKRGWDTLTLDERTDTTLYKAVFEILSSQDPELVVLKQAISEGSENTDLSRVAIETKELIAPSPEEAFVEEVLDLDIDLVLLPESEHSKSSKVDEGSWYKRLLLDAPCQVAFIRGCPDECEPAQRILVAFEGQVTSDDELALRRACQLAVGQEFGEVTLLGVRPDDDVVARQVAERHLKELLRSRDKQVNVVERIELADSLSEGIKRLELGKFDLVLVGTRNQKTIRKLLREVGFDGEKFHVPLATIRQAVPLGDRLWSKMRKSIRSFVPQLDRERRVDLVDRLESSSNFDFDFVALISLSTLIAGLGLARNSGAVVIGAMLVAPLMTPLVGMGFALVQGNEKLIRSAMKSVVLGFTVALGIGAAIGILLFLFAPHFKTTPEMMGRDMPNLLDMVVALASGVAGAYAMGRPNLISAIPGVAIAAALVPPIATSGLALAMGNFSLAGGASLLFLTNIVAIVLGTAITFWSVGVSTRKTSDSGRPPAKWPRYWFFAFVILSFVLAAAMTIVNPVDPAPPANQ